MNSSLYAKRLSDKPVPITVVLSTIIIVITMSILGHQSISLPLSVRLVILLLLYDYYHNMLTT